MNPIFLEIGNIQIYWYSIFILIAFLVGGRIVLIEAKRFNISEGFIINLFFYFYLVLSLLVYFLAQSSQPKIPQANLPLLFQKKIPLYTAAMSSFGNIRL